MEENVKLAVIAPCIAPTRDYIRLLDESAIGNGIAIFAYGVGHQFTDWRTMLISETVPELRRLSAEYSHVLCVDGKDTLFISGIAEITRKYQIVGSPPCLMSHDQQNPGSVVRLNAGCYIGEISYMADLWTRLAQEYPTEGDYQQWVQNSWPIEGMACDSECQIFQSVDDALKTAYARVLNLWHGQMPCILHFRGGYCDPVTGREDRILPVLKQLYGE